MSLIDFKNIKIGIDEEQIKRLQDIAKAAVPVLVGLAILTSLICLALTIRAIRRARHNSNLPAWKEFNEKEQAWAAFSFDDKKNPNGNIICYNEQDEVDLRINLTNKIDTRINASKDKGKEPLLDSGDIAILLGGAPGIGKSAAVTATAKYIKNRGEKVAIMSISESSFKSSSIPFVGRNIATKVERFFQEARERAKKINGYVVVNIEEMDFLVQDPDAVHVLLRELSGADSAANKNLIFIGTTNNMKSILKIRTEDIDEQMQMGERNWVDSILGAFQKKRKNPATNDIDKARMDGSIERRLNPITIALPDKECIERLLNHYIRDKTLKSSTERTQQLSIADLPLNNLVGFTSQFIVQNFAAYIRDLINKGETKKAILAKAAIYIDRNTSLKQNNFNIMVTNTVAKVKEIFEQGKGQFNSATDSVLLKIDELKDFLQTKAGIAELLEIYRNMVRLKTSELLEYQQKLVFLTLAKKEFAPITEELTKHTKTSITQEYELKICDIAISKAEHSKKTLEKIIAQTKEKAEKFETLKNQGVSLETVEASTRTESKSLENPKEELDKLNKKINKLNEDLAKIEKTINSRKTDRNTWKTSLKATYEKLELEQQNKKALTDTINSRLHLEGNWCNDRIDAEINELKQNINRITGISGFSNADVDQPNDLVGSIVRDGIRMMVPSGNFHRPDRPSVKELSAFSALNGMISQLEKLLQAYEIECGAGLSAVVKQAEGLATVIEDAEIISAYIPSRMQQWQGG